MSRIRVAHIITRLCKGGAQENTFHTVRLHNRDRYEVDLIAGPPEGPEGDLEPRIHAEGIPITRVPNLVRDMAPLRDFKALDTLTSLLREGNYTIVHTHTSKAGFIGRWAARRARVPVVIHTPHGNIFDGYFPLGLTRCFVALERRAARWSDAIIELTQRGIEESLAQGIGKAEQYEAIFSGVDFAPCTEAISQRHLTRLALGIARDEFLIGAVGRLEPVKGMTYFIAAAVHIAEAVPAARFVVVGQGSEMEKLRAQAAPLGDRVQFLGYRDDVPNLMAAMDVLVVPSINEGMGRVILEAAAARTVAVATNVGGIPEVIDDSKTGVLVPPRSPEAIAGVVGALARDPERVICMGLAAREHVLPRYGLEAMVARIEDLYERILKEKNCDA